MNNKTNTILLTLLLAVAVIGLVINLQPKQTQPAPVVNVLGDVNEWYKAGSNTTVLISSSTWGATNTTQVLAENTGRQYARIQNMGASNVTCILSGTTTAIVANKGIVLTSSTAQITSIYEITPNNLYKGVVKCIGGNASGTVQVIEK